MTPKKRSHDHLKSPLSYDGTDIASVLGVLDEYCTPKKCHIGLHQSASPSVDSLLQSFHPLLHLQKSTKMASRLNRGPWSFGTVIRLIDHRMLLKYAVIIWSEEVHKIDIMSSVPNQFRQDQSFAIRHMMRDREWEWDPNDVENRKLGIIYIIYNKLLEMNVDSDRQYGTRRMVHVGRCSWLCFIFKIYSLDMIVCVPVSSTINNNTFLISSLSCRKYLYCLYSFFRQLSGTRHLDYCLYFLQSRQKV